VFRRARKETILIGTTRRKHLGYIYAYLDICIFDSNFYPIFVCLTSSKVSFKELLIYPGRGIETPPRGIK
jgi:hypothetical protein